MELRQIAQPQKIIATAKNKYKTLHSSDPRRPGEWKTKGQAKAIQIKTIRLSAYGTLRFSENFYFLLKG